MKKTKSILLAAIAAVAVGSASAQVTNDIVINVTGSTALRHVQFPALHSFLDSDGYTLIASETPLATIGRSHAAIYSKLGGLSTNTSTIRGKRVTTVSRNRTIVNVRFAGAEGGMRATAVPGGTMPFYPLSALTNTPGATLPLTAATNAQPAQITFSDGPQNLSRYFGKPAVVRNRRVITQGVDFLVPASTTINGSTISQLPILNFVFFTTTNCPITNITARQAQALFSRGHLPLSFFTGNPADSNNGVIAMGRNIDSGTRTGVLEEIGSVSTAAVKQYDFNTTNRALSITPAKEVNGLMVGEGNGGENSGGTLAEKVSAATNLVSANAAGLGLPYTGDLYVISYAGAPDVNSTDSKRANLKALDYNGVRSYAPTANKPGFQTNFNGIANGSYSLWSHGFIYYKPGSSAAVKAIAEGTLANISKVPTDGSTGLGSGYTAIGDLKVNTARTEGAVFPSTK